MADEAGKGNPRRNNGSRLSGEQIAEIAARDQLHQDERRFARRFMQIVDSDDVRMAEKLALLCLAAQIFQGGLVVSDLRRK